MNKICETENLEKKQGLIEEVSSSKMSSLSLFAIGAGILLDIGIVLYAVISNLV